MPNIIFLIGPPMSGKSTIRERYDPRYTVISSDDIIEEYAREEGITYSQAFDLYVGEAMNQTFREFDDAVKLRQNIIIDRTNMSRKSRAAFLKKLPSDYHRTAIVMDWKSIPAEEMQRRLTKRQEEGKVVPQMVIDQMIDKYEDPTTDEFDQIWSSRLYR